MKLSIASREIRGLFSRAQCFTELYKMNAVEVGDHLTHLAEMLRRLVR